MVRADEGAYNRAVRINAKRRQEALERQKRWDHDYMALAEFWAIRKSKDPSTQVGALVVSADGLRLHLGYNGFPRGVDDSPERYADRDLKYPRVVHSELNAILNAGIDARGGTLYVNPLFSCNECAKAAIQAGIVRVVANKPAEVRWMSAYDVAVEMYEEAGVEVVFYE